MPPELPPPELPDPELPLLPELPELPDEPPPVPPLGTPVDEPLLGALGETVPPELELELLELELLVLVPDEVIALPHSLKP